MTTIFFIHDMWCTARVWDNYRAYFADLGYRTKAVALPQHFTKNQAVHTQGLSLSNYLEAVEEEYLELASQAQDIVIIGHGMGALLAQQLATRVHAKALVLLAPASPAGVGSPVSPTKNVLSQLSFSALLNKSFKPSLSLAKETLFNQLDNERANKYYEQLCFESTQAIKELWLWYADTQANAALEHDKVDCPVMTLIGNKDKLCSARAARKNSRLLRQGRHFHKLIGYGHMLPLEDTSYEVARQIHVWLCWQLGLQNTKAETRINISTAAPTPLKQALA